MILQQTHKGHGLGFFDVFLVPKLQRSLSTSFGESLIFPDVDQCRCSKWMIMRWFSKVQRTAFACFTVSWMFG